MLAIAGGKGGVGKTTTALGIAVALAARRRDPIVIDADADMPNLHLIADVDDGGIDALAEGAPIEEASAVSGRFDGIRVVGSRSGAPIERALRSLVTDRPVVIDAPAGASRDAVLPLRVADHAVVVTTPDPEAVQDAEKTDRMARTVDTEVVAYVVNRTSSVSDELQTVAGEATAIPVPATATPPLEARDAYAGVITAWANA